MCAAGWSACVLLVAFSHRLAAVVLRAILFVRAVGCPDGLCAAGWIEKKKNSGGCHYSFSRSLRMSSLRYLPLLVCFCTCS